MIVKLGENWPVPVASGGDRAFNVKEQNFGGGENQEKQERGKGGEGGEKQKRGGKEEQEGENRRKDNHAESLPNSTDLYFWSLFVNIQISKT